MRRLKPSQACSRCNCGKRRVDGSTFCGDLCEAVDAELTDVENILRSVTPGRLTGKLWGCVTTINDNLTELAHLKSMLRNHVENPREEVAQ